MAATSVLIGLLGPSGTFAGLTDQWPCPGHGGSGGPDTCLTFLSSCIDVPLTNTIVTYLSIPHDVLIYIHIVEGLLPSSEVIAATSHIIFLTFYWNCGAMWVPFLPEFPRVRAVGYPKAKEARDREQKGKKETRPVQLTANVVCLLYYYGLLILAGELVSFQIYVSFVKCALLYM